MMVKTKATMRDTTGLADAMFEEFDLLRDGKSTPQQARAKAAVANTILSTKKLEMDAARFGSAATVKAVKFGR